MDHPHAAASAPRNRLLAALPPASLAALWPRLQPVDLLMRHKLMTPGEAIPALFFPEDAYASMLVRFQDGASAEVGMVGAEGVVGLPLLLGARTALVEAMVQGPGTVLRLPAEALPRVLGEVDGLRPLLLRYVLAFHEQVAQTAACNLRHGVDRRLARWLLMAHDRSEGAEFPMTHEFLAMLLCAARPGVTTAVRRLRDAGLIHHQRGRVAVTDRPGLEDAACECYGIVRRRSRELLAV